MRLLKINAEAHKTEIRRIKVSEHKIPGAHKISRKNFERKITSQDGEPFLCFEFNI